MRNKTHTKDMWMQKSPQILTQMGPQMGIFFLILQKMERFISKISCCLRAIINISGFISSCDCLHIQEHCIYLFNFL